MNLFQNSFVVTNGYTRSLLSVTCYRCDRFVTGCSCVFLCVVSRGYWAGTCWWLFTGGAAWCCRVSVTCGTLMVAVQFCKSWSMVVSGCNPVMGLLTGMSGCWLGPLLWQWCCVGVGFTDLCVYIGWWFCKVGTLSLWWSCKTDMYVYLVVLWNRYISMVMVLWNRFVFLLMVLWNRYIFMAMVLWNRYMFMVMALLIVLWHRYVSLLMVLGNRTVFLLMSLWNRYVCVDSMDVLACMVISFALQFYIVTSGCWCFSSYCTFNTLVLLFGGLKRELVLVLLLVMI